MALSYLTIINIAHILLPPLLWAGIVITAFHNILSLSLRWLLMTVGGRTRDMSILLFVQY